MSTKAPPKKSGNAGAAVLVGLLVLIGMGWFSSQDADDTSDDRSVDVEFQVLWGQVIDTGETYPDTGRPILRNTCDHRRIVIRYWVDGQEYRGDQDEGDATEPCIWSWTVPGVPVGTEVRLRVQERRDSQAGGWKTCSIFAQGRIVVPNGTGGADGLDACEADGLVYP